MINIVENFLNNEELDQINRLCHEKGFSSGWKSGKDSPSWHWNIRFAGELWGDATSPVTEHDVPKIVWDIWTKINFDQDRSIVRAYVNAYTYGTEGSIHTDSDRDDSKTHLIYINPSWKPEWAGETVFFVNNEIFRAILPKPGRMVEFPGNIPHDARSVSRLSNVLRKVLVYKSMPCS